VIGLAHATKPSLLPALGFFLLFAVAKEVGPLCVKLIKWPRIASHPQFDVQAFSMRLVSIALVVVVFLGTVYPYINSNEKAFGSYFYCVSTTFYMWYDSWEEAKQGTKAHGGRKGWPDMPPDQIPSLGKYLREHTAQQIVDRIVNGLKTLYQRSVESYGYYKYVLTLYSCSPWSFSICVMVWRWRPNIFSFCCSVSRTLPFICLPLHGTRPSPAETASSWLCFFPSCLSPLMPCTHNPRDTYRSGPLVFKSSWWMC
jgi:hypothetical protein